VTFEPNGSIITGNKSQIPMNAVTIVCSGLQGPFQVIMQNSSLCVISIAPNAVPSCAWLLYRQYALGKRDKDVFQSLLLDDDGLSFVCSPLSCSILESLQPNGITISSQRWIALIINVSSAAEFPGAVNYLANLLSKEGISVLHIATFESEVFLVQEKDIERACDVMKKTDDPKEIAEMLEITNRKQQQKSLSNDKLSSLLRDENNTDSVFANATSSINREPSPSLSSAPFKEGFILCALPRNVMLAKFTSEEYMLKCSDLLTRLMLFDSRYNKLERIVEKGNIVNSINLNNNIEESPSFMFGIWKCQDEYTLLLEENDVALFPEDALIVSPQRWKVIKLCGRSIEFDETGIVSAMSKIEHEVLALNISTATTNCTLVPEEQLENSLNKLSEVLKCPYKIL